MENPPFAYVVLAFALAVGGGALGATLGTSHQRLCALISLGAGTLLGVTVFGLLPECLEGPVPIRLSLPLSGTDANCQRRKVAAFIVPRSRMEALIEQMEALANPEAMKAVRRARRGKVKYHPLSALDER